MPKILEKWIHAKSHPKIAFSEKWNAQQLENESY